MTQPVLECTNPWETECQCGSRWAPCWPRPDTSCCDRLEPENPTPEQAARIERMLHVATEIIWRLSGKQFGGCPVTLRPCRQTCAGGTVYGYWSGNTWTPVLEGGQWFNDKCGKCAPSGCSCTELCEVDLPGPISEVLQVKLDGLILDPELYRLDNSRKLVRQDVSIVAATDISPGFATNMGDASSRICTQTEPVSATDVNPVAGPQPPWCYQPAQPPLGQEFTLLPGCQEFTITPAAGDTTPLALFSDLVPVYTFPGGTALTPGGQFVSSAWTDNHRMLVRLISGPATSVDAGGVIQVVPGASRFRVCFERRLYGDSGGCWPTCQDLSKPDTEVGTFSVQVRPGAAVPQGGLWAAGLLACQLLKACDGDAECTLPANAQRIARQGVTVELTPVLIDRDAGGFLTGIPEVDLWLESVNPYKAKMPSRVFSIDRPRPRVTTWPC